MPREAIGCGQKDIGLARSSVNEKKPLVRPQTTDKLRVGERPGKEDRRQIGSGLTPFCKGSPDDVLLLQDSVFGLLPLRIAFVERQRTQVTPVGGKRLNRPHRVHDLGVDRPLGLLGIKTQFPYAIAAAAGDECVLHQFEGGLAKPGRVFDRAVLVRIAGVLVGRVQKRVESEKIAGTLSESEEDSVRCELMFQDDGAPRLRQEFVDVGQDRPIHQCFTQEACHLAAVCSPDLSHLRLAIPQHGLQLSSQFGFRSTSELM